MILAAQIPDAALGWGLAFAGAVFLALASWALYQLVQNGQVLAALSAEYRERSEDHERRIAALEARPFGRGR